MAHQWQITGLSITLLNILVVFCFHPQVIEGNSFEQLEEPSGEFRSPGYPDLDDDMHCTWKVIAPPNHKITLTFLDFNLVERPICTDKVEIHGGNVGEGPYIQSQPPSQIVTSTSNTISVVLTSCGTSLFSDRRGINVAYSTVYPTTLVQETSSKVTTTVRITPSTKPVEITVKETFSPPKYPMSSKNDASTPSFFTRPELHPKLNNSNSNKEQFSTKNSGYLVPAVLAGLLVTIVIVIIIITVIVKRRKTELHSNASIATNENHETSCEQISLPTVVAEGIEEDNGHLEYDYVQGTSALNERSERVFLDQNCPVVSTKMSFPRLQKKQPLVSSDKDVFQYENNANNMYENTDFDDDYSNASCTIKEASPKVDNNDRQLQRQDSNIDLDAGLVVNSAYEPYIS